FMNTHLTPLVLDDVEIVEHPASLQCNPGYFSQTLRIVQESLQAGTILLRTKVQLGGMIQENIVRNLPALLDNPNVSALDNLFPSVPALVVGAGPSLDANGAQLKLVQEQGILIAVDTVYKKLLSMGIEPHIVVSTDPTYLNARHFEGVNDLDETLFVFSPSVYSPIVTQLKGTKVSIPLVGSRFLATLKELYGDAATFKTGVNVGQTAFNLARFMGCDPIILVGLDYSFSPQGGPTHATGTALQRQVFVSETPGKMKVELLGTTPELEEFDPILIPGNTTDSVATNKFFFSYLRSMEEEIRQTQARVINCTEGGAKIAGAEIAPLRETIAAVCIQDVMGKSTLQMATGFFFGMFKGEGKAVVNHCLDILNTALQEAEKGIQLLGHLQFLSQDSTVEPAVLASLIQDIIQTHEALVQKQMLYVVLDEAADRVLHPFLKQSVRMMGNEPTPQNINKVLVRYQPYFTGIKQLCEQFKAIYEETLGRLEDDSFDFFQA
ncbi:MAG: DUF115 domain-containing protein, partial [bacterium]|nr:DUF115 domain-containing protein [bacterium]